MQVRLSRIGKIGTVGLAKFELATRAIRHVSHYSPLGFPWPPPLRLPVGLRFALAD
jgi:hypothetical protein